MSRRTAGAAHRRRAVLVGAGVALAALLPLAPVAAVVDPVPTAVSFVKCPDLGADPQTCDRILWSSDPTDAGGTQPIPGPAAVQLTAAGYQVYGHDVSADGSTWVAAMRRGSASTIGEDSTYAMVLVHTDGTHVTTRILTTFWDTNPVISADGTKVWWLVRDPVDTTHQDYVYRFTATYGVDGAISGSTSIVSMNQFGYLGSVVDDSAQALAISPDGLSAAVIYWDAPGTHLRVRASRLSVDASPPAAFQKSYDTTTVDKTWLSTSLFAFTDNSTLLFGEADSTSTAPEPPVTALTATIPDPLGSDTAATTPAPALDSFYDVHPFHGSLLAWKDTWSGSTFAGTVFGTTTSTGVAPAPLTARTDGDTTSGYRPSEATPPVLPTYLPTRLATHANLRLSATSVISGRAAAVAGYALYAQTPGPYFDPTWSNEVDRGVLAYSYSKTGPWTTLRTTTGAHWVTVGAAPYNTVTQKLTRTTWFRWTVASDAFVTGSTSSIRAVGVAPIITARVTRSGSRRIVSGTATRRAGTALLQHKVGTRYVTVATTKLTTAGAFTFGRRSLVRGTYRVVAVGDASWLTGYRALTI